MSEWISMKERLPEGEEVVLAVVHGRPTENIRLEGALELAEWSREEGWILEMWPEWENPAVTHWMPLPEPPEEG